VPAPHMVRRWQRMVDAINGTWVSNSGENAGSKGGVRFVIFFTTA